MIDSTSVLIIQKRPWFGRLLGIAMGWMFIQMGMMIKDNFGYFMGGCGFFSIVLAFVFPSTRIIVDNHSGSLTREWRWCCGWVVKVASISLSEVVSIEYGRIVTTYIRGSSQEFHLAAVSTTGERMNLFPATLTPRNAPVLGRRIANHMGVEYTENLG